MGGRMLDTQAVARSLTDAEFTPAQADAITNAVRQAAEHGDQVTSDQFKTGLAELRTEMAGQRADELTGQISPSSPGKLLSNAPRDQRRGRKRQVGARTYVRRRDEWL